MYGQFTYIWVGKHTSPMEHLGKVFFGGVLTQTKTIFAYSLFVATYLLLGGGSGGCNKKKQKVGSFPK